MSFTSPVLSYTLLSPMLILLGGALIGVLVEAFVSKALRPVVQLTLTLGSLLLALMQVWRIRGQQSLTAAMGSVTIDGPAILLEASILISSRVRGLRPIRSARALTEKVPKPASVTVPSCFRVAVTVSITASRARLAEALEISAALAISSISSVLFTDIPSGHVVQNFLQRVLD